MSRFFSEKFKDLAPYTPGEQPKDFKYIKLNTNESPFPPSQKAICKANEQLGVLNLYPDPTCSELVKTASQLFNVEEDEIIFGNGSDELLYLSFLAFGQNGVVFPDITYGFYSVYAKVCNICFEEIPLNYDFKIDIKDYFNKNKTIFIANPNAPTGIALSTTQIEEILINNKESVVVIDEAYVDFGGESCISLTKKYDNLLVIQTFSKSRSMAGARLGFAVGNQKLIKDLNRLKFSFNPYNINKITMACGIGALSDEIYAKANSKKIIENREFTILELKKLGFNVLDSMANFVFASHNKVFGKDIYLKLKQKGVLVRYFDKERLKNFNRITIGTKEQMQILIDKLKEILEEN